jgi:hypothetical protein
MLSTREIRRADALDIEAIGGVDYVSTLVNQILKEHGDERPMFTMTEPAEFREILEADNHGTTLVYDLTKSVTYNVNLLFRQVSGSVTLQASCAAEITLLQHLVSALLSALFNQESSSGFPLHWKLDPTNSFRTLLMGDTCIHITTSPSEILMRQCFNVKSGFRPFIVTTPASHVGACSLALLHGLQDRVDIFDAAQFIATHLYARSLYKKKNQILTIENLLNHYNDLVRVCETDPGIPIRIKN